MIRGKNKGKKVYRYVGEIFACRADRDKYLFWRGRGTDMVFRLLNGHYSWTYK
jgi:hypothetical protein